MKQRITTALILIGLISCVSTRQQQTNSILGKWDNKSGQILDFRKDGKAFWIFYTDVKRDTFEIQYRTDFSKKPREIDLTDFKVGPLKGKTLYGIVEFTDKKTIRLDFEPTQENRPREFDQKQTQTYHKIE
ncbi:MAG: hypothetical protein KF775_16100 [Cyclobacteriaceae bacterium]|nr:hypothetical protein [Cyclobacteriaceae bacterium]